MQSAASLSAKQAKKTEANTKETLTVSTHSAAATSSTSVVCEKLAAQSAYYLAKIAQLEDKKIAVPPYLAGYEAASYDAEVAMGCVVASAKTSKKATTKDAKADGKTG